jgi:hypothetical protein
MRIRVRVRRSVVVAVLGIAAAAVAAGTVSNAQVALPDRSAYRVAIGDSTCPDFGCGANRNEVLL